MVVFFAVFWRGSAKLLVLRGCGIYVLGFDGNMPETVNFSSAPTFLGYETCDPFEMISKSKSGRSLIITGAHMNILFTNEVKSLLLIEDHVGPLNCVSN